MKKTVFIFVILCVLLVTMIITFSMAAALIIVGNGMSKVLGFAMAIEIVDFGLCSYMLDRDFTKECKK